MRITSLRFTGIGPYRTEQHIDFEGFADDGIYLISGRTGAGKSTILDAICFALYDAAPRFDKTKMRMRSDHCEPQEPSSVTLEFATRGRHYRLTRTPEYERPAKRGTGTVVEKPTALLEVRKDGVWQGVAAKSREVGLAVDEVVGLGKDQFLQVILLAQNRFQRFLLATNEERQKVLRALFGSQRFADAQGALAERRRAQEAVVASARGDLARFAAQAAGLAGAPEVPQDPSPGWFAGLPDLLDEEEAAARAAKSAADAQVAAADAADRAARVAKAGQDRLAAARAEHLRLVGQQPAFALQQAELELAGKADRVHPQLRTAAAARRDRATAAEALRQARAQYQAAFDEEPDAAHAKAAALSEQLGALREALAQEQRLPALARAEREARDGLDTADADLEGHRLRAATLPDKVEGLAARLADLRAAAARLGDLRTRLAEVTARQAAAAQLVQAAARQRKADLELERAAAANTAAAAAHLELVRRKLAGYAGELAGQLQDGRPCLVCGSPEHPAPTVAAAGPVVTQGQIDGAAAEVADKGRALDRAGAAARTAAEQVARLRAQAGDADAAALAQLVADTAGQVRVAEDAAGQVGPLQQQRAAAQAELDAAAARTADLEQRREQAREALTVAQTARAAVAAQVAGHRGQFDSVAEHVQALTALVGLARACVAAAEADRAAAATAAQAQSVLTELLAANGFADTDALNAAYRTEAQCGQLRRAVNGYDKALAAVEATLRDPLLADLPEEPVDPAPAAEALRAARAARDEAVRAEATVAEKRRVLGGLVAQAARKHADYADDLERYTQIRVLADTVNGTGPNTRHMDLETFVLAAQLEEVIAAANARLRTMTSGRYALEHDDGLAYRNRQSGLGLAIHDAYTGQSRATSSLSGGETFLASLSLALGLADVVTAQAGGVCLETLFIDEGFGSLDPETLEVAMGTLDSLRAGGRTVGLISHVDVMKERIPARLKVTVTGRGDSVIEGGT